MLRDRRGRPRARPPGMSGVMSGGLGPDQDPKPEPQTLPLFPIEGPASGRQAPPAEQTPPRAAGDGADLETCSDESSLPPVSPEPEPIGSSAEVEALSSEEGRLRSSTSDVYAALAGGGEP